MNFRMSEHGNLLICEGALRAVRVVAYPIVCFVEVLFGRLCFWLKAVQDVFWRRRVWKVLCMKGA